MQSWPMPDGPWPLIGRARELGRLLATYGGSNERVAAGALVTGDVGVGKTRLVREAARAIASPAGTAHVTATRSAASIPLGAMAHLLPAGEAVSTSLDAFRALLARFQSTAATRPVLVVDDAHLLDDESAALLFHLVAQQHVFALLTSPARAPSPDAVAALWRDDLVARIDLQPLSDSAIGEILAVEFGNQLDHVGLRSLVRASGGNPLLLRELLRAAVETQALRQLGNRWRWSGGDFVTRRLYDVVRHHIVAPTDQGSWHLGELLAYGQPLTVSMALSLVDGPTIVAAERTELVRVEQSGARHVVRLARTVYADVIRHGTPRSHQREIFRMLVDALGGTPLRRQEDHLLAVQWRRGAGLPVPSDLIPSAARLAMNRLDPGLGKELAELARAQTGWAGELTLAEVLASAGRYEEASRALPHGQIHVRTAEEQRRWLITRDQVRFWTTPAHRPDAVLADGDDHPSATLDADVEAARTWLMVFAGAPAEAMRVGQEVLRTADLTPEARNWATAAVLAAAGVQGQHATVMSLLDSGLALAERHIDRHVWGPMQVAVAGCLALTAGGHLRRAAELADRGYRWAVEVAAGLGPGATVLVGVGAAVRGVVARTQGRIAAAGADLAEAAELLVEVPAFRMGQVYLAALATVRALAEPIGNPDGHQLDTADPPGPFFDAWVERDRGWIAAARGDVRTARTHLHTAATLASQTGQPTLEALALFDAARLGQAGLVLPRLCTLACGLGDTVVPVLAATACALDAGDADELQSAAKVLADFGHLLYAAEAAAVAHRLYARAGIRARAQTSLAQMMVLVGECGRVQTPLLGLSGLYELLTPRELQVVRLAADGQSSPDIAERLSLSVRTVDNYLGRAYHKLGVSGRSQLAALLASAAPLSAIAI